MNKYYGLTRLFYHILLHYIIIWPYSLLIVSNGEICAKMEKLMEVSLIEQMYANKIYVIIYELFTISFVCY